MEKINYGKALAQTADPEPVLPLYPDEQQPWGDSEPGETIEQTVCRVSDEVTNGRWLRMPRPVSPQEDAKMWLEALDRLLRHGASRAVRDARDALATNPNRHNRRRAAKLARMAKPPDSHSGAVVREI